MPITPDDMFKKIMSSMPEDISEISNEIDDNPITLKNLLISALAMSQALANILTELEIITEEEIEAETIAVAINIDEDISKALDFTEIERSLAHDPEKS